MKAAAGTAVGAALMGGHVLLKFSSSGNDVSGLFNPMAERLLLNNALRNSRYLYIINRLFQLLDRSDAIYFYPFFAGSG